MSKLGIGMIVLQVLRALTLAGLMAAEVALIISVIKINTDHSAFFVFEAVSRVFAFFFCLFLTVSEVGVFSNFYRKNCPALSDKHGLSSLGLALIAIGCIIMGKLNDPNSTPEKLGGIAFWRVIISAGIVNFIFGVFNVIASQVFSDRKNGVNARHVRSHGDLAADHVSDVNSTTYTNYAQSQASYEEVKPAGAFRKMFWRRNTPKTEAGRPNISAPLPAYNETASTHERSLDNDQLPVHNPAVVDIERDADNMVPARSPIDPSITRPDSIYHPINHPRASSRYSAAHMSRF